MTWDTSLRHVASRYLLMRCEGCKDFPLLARRYFEEVKGAPKLGRYLVEFFWRDLEVAVRLLETQFSLSRLCWREFERAARDLADPQGSHELETWQPAQVFVCHSLRAGFF